MKLHIITLALGMVFFTAYTDEQMMIDDEQVITNDQMIKSSPRDKNIGYKLDDAPVPASALCLDPQAVLGETTLISYGGAVEPSVAVNPTNDNHIVACWQESRINNTGALEIGIARSHDGGHEWHRTVIPLQNCIGGFIQRASDCWLSYAPDGRLYLSAVVFNATQDIDTLNQSGVVVSMSEDNGKEWSNPHFVVASQDYVSLPMGTFPVPDKPSITADSNNDTNAYIVWDMFDTATSFHAPAYIARTINAGTTWLPFQLLYDPSNDPGIVTPFADTQLRQTTDNTIVVLPAGGPDGGNLLNFMARIYPSRNATTEEYMSDTWPFKFVTIDIAYVRSTDQGATWQTDATVIATVLQGTAGLDPLVWTEGYMYDMDDKVMGGKGQLMRTGDSVPSFAVNPVNGYLYAVWQTSLLSTHYPKHKRYLPQIALSTSRDGGLTWSKPVKVNQTPEKAANPQAFTPFVAVDHRGHVGVLYSDFRHNKTIDAEMTNTDTWLAVFKETTHLDGGSTGIGLDFKKEHRLSKDSYIAQNGPQTTSGIMTNGDYSFLVASTKRLYALYTQSFNGPFVDPIVVYSVSDTISDSIVDTVIKLDPNLRTQPFFSRVKGSST